MMVAAAILVAFVILHRWPTKPTTDTVSLTKALRATTSEPILHVIKLDNDSTRLMVVTRSASEQHRYVLAWSGSHWQISEAFVKP